MVTHRKEDHDIGGGDGFNGSIPAAATEEVELKLAVHEDPRGPFKQRADHSTGDAEIPEHVLGVEEEAVEEAKELFKNLDWFPICLIMTAEVIGLGSLSLPEACSILGIGGFIITLAILAVVATWTGLMLQSLKLEHPSLFYYFDLGPLYFGRFGFYVMVFFTFIGQWVGVAGNGLTAAIALANISGANGCLVIWFVITYVVIFLLTQRRTVTGVSWAMYLALVFILIPLVVTLIQVPAGGNVDKRPNRNWGTKDNASFQDMVVAVNDVVYAYAGHCFYFVFMSEMAKPQDFHKALILSNSLSTAFYLVLGLVIYIFSDKVVTSPALNMLPLVLRRVMYGIILIHVIIIGSFAAISVMQHIYADLYGLKEVTQYTKKSIVRYAFWSAVMIAITFVIVEVIPFFSEFISLASAISSIWLTYGMPPLFYAESIRRRYKKEGKSHTSWTITVIVVCYSFFVFTAALAVMGFVGAVLQIRDNYKNDIYGTPFTCDASSYYP